MNRTVSLFVASVLVGASFPLTTQALFRYQGTPLHSAAAGETAVVARRVKRVYDRKDLKKALEIYQALVQRGDEGLVQPNINRPSTIKVYLDQYPDGAPRAEDDDVADPVTMTDYVPAVTFSTVTEPEKADRAALTEARRIGKCYSGKFASAAAYKECLRITKYLKPVNTQGLSNPLQGLKTKQIEEKKARAEAK